MASYSGIESISYNLCGAEAAQILYKLPVRPQYAGKFNRDTWDIVRCHECVLV